MKKIYLIIASFLILSFIQKVYCQNNSNKVGFKIINNSKPEKEDFYYSALEKADMEQYRLKDKDVTLQFDNGFECVVMSAKQLFLINNTINPSLYQEDYPMDTYSLPIFFITEAGLIKAKNTKTYKKALSRN